MAMRRRDFIKAVVGSASFWPLVTHAQLPAMPVIGFLDGQSPNKQLMTAFRKALEDAGYIEGRNVAIEYRSAYGQTDRLVLLAGDLVIVATGAPPPQSPPTRLQQRFRLSSQATPIQSLPVLSSAS